MSLNRHLPVLLSIAILLVVAVLRDRSRTAAAIVATMPINIPLALWIVSSGAGGDSRLLTDFVRSLFISLIPSLIWLGVVFVLLRAGWGVLAAIGAAYGVWAVLIGGLLALGMVRVPM